MARNAATKLAKQNLLSRLDHLRRDFNLIRGRASLVRAIFGRDKRIGYHRGFPKSSIQLPKFLRGRYWGEGWRVQDIKLQHRSRRWQWPGYSFFLTGPVSKS